MKKHFFILTVSALVLTAFSNARAQKIDGATWTDGFTEYTVTKNNADLRFESQKKDFSFEISQSGKYMFTITDSGEKEAFGQKDFMVQYKAITIDADKNFEVLMSYDEKKQIYWFVQKDISQDKKLYETSMHNMLQNALKQDFEILTEVRGEENEVLIRISGKNYAVQFHAGRCNLYNTTREENDSTPRATSLYKSLKLTDSGKGWWPATSDMVLNMAVLKLFDKWQLRIMRNEIYARHGYKFPSKEMEQHFLNFPWYKPSASKVTLSELEELNVELIDAAEKMLKE